MNTISHCIHPPQPAGLGPNTAPGTARRPLALAITSLLLAGALGGEARAQAFPPVIELGSLSGADGFRLDGVAAGDYSGFSVAAAGDINGDGIDDLIIGAWGAAPNGSQSGSSYVVFGKDTATAGDFLATLDLSSLDGTNGFRLDGVAAFDQSGRSVAAAGDINGDGIDDLIIGAPYADPNGSNSGSSYVVFGRDTVNGPGFPATLALSSLDGSNGFRLDGVAGGDRSGRSVAAAGDINGDGIDDLVVGAPFADPNGNNNAGSSYVVFGRDTVNGPGFPATLDLSSLDGSNGFRLDGVAAFDQSGRSVAAAGDINGDGIDDLIIGAPFADPNGNNNAGSSYVVFGRDTVNGPVFPATLALSSLDGSNGFRLDGVAAGNRSGRSVAAAGDINGDGIDDLIIGGPYADPNGSDSGSSYVVFGRDTVNGPGFPATLALSSLDGSNGFRLDGAAAFDFSGHSVAAAGDINGDGIDDLIIGAFGADPNGSYSGSSYVLFGRDTATQGDFPATLALSSLNGPSGFRLDGAAAFDRSGFSVAAAGDINGDGIGDLVVGAHRASPNGSNSGSSYVVFGRVTGLPVLDFDANLIDFGQVFVGGSAPAQTLTLSNPGSGLVAVNAIDLPNPAFALIGGNCGPLPIRIRVGENCTLDVQFAPQTGGFAQTQMTFTSTSVTSPDSIVLQGTGVQAQIALTPDPLDFGNVLVGATSAAQTVTVSNPGSAPLNVSTIDTAVAPFALSGGTCGAVPFTVAVAGSCTLSYSFSPTITGPASQTLSVTSDAAPGSDNQFSLQGTGVPAPIVSLMPDPLDFGDVALDATATEILIVENTGDGTLQPGALSITGPQAGDFSIQMNNCANAQLSSSQSCGIEIRFAPAGPGIRQATLSLQSNAPSSPDLVQLRGNNDALFADRFEVQ